MEIGEFQHQDFVWTWKSNRAGSRVSLWLPYFDGVERVKGTRYRFRYNGGEFEADLKQVDFIMLYGASGTLPVQFLDDLNTQRITLFVHRRNLPKSAYVAAYVARREAYFDRLGIETSRRESGPWKSALDAGSMFLYGVVLRWILFHKLSPARGFLHLPTSYPSLAYDLMEPYRYLIEQATGAVFAKTQDEAKLTAGTLARLKTVLDEPVYVPATRQTVRRKNLLHGGVLALRAYLVGESLRLVLPVEGVRAGGRPPRTGYALPGAMLAQA